MPLPEAAQKAEDLRRFLNQLAKAEAPHKQRCERWAKMDSAYQGMLADAAKARPGEVFPKYALSVVETIKAGIIDDKPQLKLIPTTISQDRIDGAKCLTDLIEYQRKMLGYNRERNSFVDQVLIRGIGVAKIPWVYETIQKRKRQFIPAMGQDGQPGGYRSVGFSEFEECVTKQGAGYVNVNVMDFMWDPGATKWDDVDHVFHRTWVTPASLRRMKKLGVYDWTEGDEPKPGGMPNPANSEARGFNVKDRIELIEQWSYTPDGVWLRVAANRQQIIRDCHTPLEHEQLPYVCATTNPGLFTVEGMSEVEIVMEEQAAIWELLNTNLENARWQNNCTVFLDEALRGADDLSLEPGAKNYVNGDPNARIKFWQPPDTMHFSQPLIEFLIAQMQSISPANPYMSGGDSSGIQNDTATGISLIQNMAQKRIQRKKEEILESDRDAALQQVALNQQLLPAAVVWAVEDNTDPTGFRQVKVDPYEIQGMYDYDADEVADAVSMQQKRQEAQNKGTFLMQVATLAPGLIDIAEIVKDFTESYDDPPDRFLAPPPPPGLAMVPPNGMPLNSAPPPGGGGGPIPGVAASPPAGGIGAPGPSLPPRPPLVAA